MAISRACGVRYYYFEMLEWCIRSCAVWKDI